MCRGSSPGRARVLPVALEVVGALDEHAAQARSGIGGHELEAIHDGQKLIAGQELENIALLEAERSPR